MIGQTVERPEGGFADALDELSERQIAMAEEHVAFEGKLGFEKWIDTSAYGFKITLSLEGRHQLDAFDGVMSYRAKRGGHRYMAICQPYWQPDGPGTPKKPDDSQQFVDEWQFAGRGWSESKGAHIAVMVADRQAISRWKLRTAGDQVTDDTGPRHYYVMLLELDDDETIVNQAKRERVVAPPTPKGGPRSKAVARMLQDPDFANWMDNHSIHSDYLGPHDRTLEQRDGMMKAKCGIKSKIEFDNGNEEAWQAWETQFHRPFIQYMQRRERR